MISALKENQDLAGRFTLLRRLGSGGMGEVWLAQDNVLHDRVALKILGPTLAGSPEMVQLLKQECRRTRRLNHPHIVRVYDFHEQDRLYFISMEYVEGGDLRRLTGADYRAILPPLLQIVQALEYAHQLGIVHRDIKASNVLWDANGMTRLTDFGIAALLHAQGDADHPLSGGSLYSMSPQQLAQQPASPGDDIYALGVLIYELVTGHPPFHPHITPARILSETPQPLAPRQPVPRQLEHLVSAMLAKAPDERPGSMAEVRLALQRLIQAEQEASGGGGRTATELQIPRKPSSIPEPLENPTLPPAASELSAMPARAAPEPIAPVARTASPRPVAHSESAMQKGVPAVWALLLFALLVGAAVGVFHYLPKQLPDKSQAKRISAAPTPAAVEPGVADSPPSSGQTAPPAPPVAGVEPPQPAPMAHDREEAEKLLAELLEKRATLEGKSVTLWAPGPFAEALAKAAQGDAFFRENEFKAAARSYGATLAILDDLIGQVKTVLSNALEDGWRAFDARDAAGAVAAFELALAVDPDNGEGKKGLARAQTLDRVLELLKSGQQYEQAGDLARARADLQKAAELDPDFGEAQEALSRVDGKINDAAFAEAMSTGLAALERKNYADARKAFDAARRLKPDAKEPLDGLAQVDREQRIQQIAKHRETAAAMEKRERWREAANHYSAALALDSTLGFAKRGKARSLERARISETVSAHISHPERLASERVLQRAIAAQREASGLADKGPVLTRQLATLSRLIQNARTLVPVRLESDNLTNITIYKVGTLGTFVSRKVELRPGTYTAVGYRNGYRDIRRQFTVTPGRAMAPIMLRCEEKI